MSRSWHRKSVLNVWSGVIVRVYEKVGTEYRAKRTLSEDRQEEGLV